MLCLVLFCSVINKQDDRHVVLFLWHIQDYWCRMNCLFNCCLYKDSSAFYIVLCPCCPIIYVQVFSFFFITAAKAYYSVRFPLSCCHAQNESSVHRWLASVQISLWGTNRQNGLVKSACLFKSIANSSYTECIIMKG